MFHPGETVEHQFIIPFTAGELAKIVVTYKQNDNIVLIKTITSGFEEASVAAKSVFSYVLTQEESLLFNETMPYKIQLNVYTKSGTRAASCELEEKNGVQHYKEVIRDG